jgi:HKD family nuclease
MAKISIQKPTDQPSGKVRLLDELRDNLKRADLNKFRIIVAFAKVGPLLRLEQDIQNWINNDKIVEAIFGIDERGTSLQALQFALAYFHQVYVAHVSGVFSPTFHPKIYLFTDQDKAVAYVGSNNLTVGGTETNLETNIKFELDLPGDAEILSELEGCWDDTLQISRELNEELLKELFDSGQIPNERETRKLTSVGEKDITKKSRPVFPKLGVIPPSPLPRKKLQKPERPKTITPPTIPTPTEASPLAAEALVLQIIPHHNGEVILSKTAVDQNPEFFGWPFAGKSTPKKPTNPAYPQREPDPVINIIVFSSLGEPIISHPDFNLNTVYYESRSEIRITVPQDVVQATPEYSIMVMKQAGIDQSYDYDIEIYTPGSEQYQAYLAVCNQTMPSGGKQRARRFGWL